MKLRLAALALAAALPAFAQAPDNTAFDAALKAAKAEAPIKAALNDRARDAATRFRDQNRFVELILSAMALKPGQRVLDVGSGGGYLALVAAKIVGETGHVDIHNTPNWINQFPGMAPAVQKQRITALNIGWITTDWHEIPVVANSYDVIVLGQVYHDVILEGGDVTAMNEKLFAMLKPGGRVVIEDHDALPTMHIGQQVGLHRIALGAVTEQMAKASFVGGQVWQHDSKADDRRFNVFVPSLRSRTDRFIAVFEKPAG